MRVTVVVPSLRLGGAEASLAKAASLISDVVDRLDVIVLADIEAAVVAQLPPAARLHVMKGRSSANPLLWVKIRRILNRLNPDVLLGWSIYANLVAIISSRGLPIRRVIVSERNYLPRLYARSRVRSALRAILFILIRSLYRKADVVTANSQASVRFLGRFIGKGPKFIELPNLIDVDYVNDYARLPPEVVPNSVDGPKILAIGRLDHQKGFDLLLQAFAVIRRIHPWTLVVVGDGPESDALRSLAMQLCIAPAVQWIGAVDNPFPYYRWADLVVVPSRFEGFPNVALEAMACGRTVICADCKSGPKELTAAGRYGVLVPANDVQRLAQAILRWGSDHPSRETLGRAAMQHIRDVYDIGRQRSHYVQTLCGA